MVQALAVDGDVLLQKPFLDLGFDGVVRWKLPASETFFQFAKHVKVQRGPVRAVRRVGWDPEPASEAGRLHLPPGLRKSHRTL
jgi:hypothetical protein